MTERKHDMNYNFTLLQHNTPPYVAAVTISGRMTSLSRSPHEHTANTVIIIVHFIQSSPT